MVVIFIFFYGMNFVKMWNGGKGVMMVVDRELFFSGEGMMCGWVVSIV